MQINIVNQSRNLIIKICGEIDHHTVGDIKDKIDKEFSRSNAKNLIFDFSQVSFMDSSGIGMVIGRYKEVEKIGGVVLISGLSNDVSRIFNISGLQKIIKSYPDTEQAIKCLKYV